MTRKMRISGLGSPTRGSNQQPCVQQHLDVKRVALVAEQSVRVYRSVKLATLITLTSRSPFLLSTLDSQPGEMDSSIFLIYELDSLVALLGRRNISV